MLRKTLTILASALALCSALPALAVGQRVDVQIVDRTTGEIIKPILHDGEWWIAGKPGAMYGVTLLNRAGRRTLNVVSIDGVNAISGQTAAWSQTGYVIGDYQSYQINGWRKNANQVAAFEFTALPDSYAARTGRPDNVGVIGIAIFDEKPVVVQQVAPISRRESTDGDRKSASPFMPVPAPPAPAAATPPPPSEAGSGSGNDAPSTVARARPQPERLGTGHGELETSTIRNVSFVRAQSTPNEIVTIHYDRIENLIAMGIVQAPMTPVAVNPFPNSERYVADPPPRR
jgi:hypothetical protein